MSALLTSCNTTYDEGYNNRLKAVKLSKFELPIPDSKAYWNGVFAEVEKKCKKHSQKTESFLPELFDVSKRNLCDNHKESYNKLMSLIRSKDHEKSTDKETCKKNISKTQKLSRASFLPGFAKTISTDTSVVAQEYLEAEAKHSRFESQSDTDPSIGVKERDFLHIPNLRFVSSQPSFHKISFEKEYTDRENISIIPNEEFLIEKKSGILEKKNLTFRDELLNKSEKFCKTKELNIKEIMSYYEKKYLYKALARIKKQRQSRNCIQNDIKYFRDDSKLKPTLAQLNKIKSTSIHYSSRSISSSIAYLERKAIKTLSDNILKEIPEARLIRRSYFDRCLACLYKPFRYQNEIMRDLPVSISKLNAQTIPNFNISSSSSSSNLLNKINNYSKYDPIKGNIIDLLKFENNLSDDSINFKSGRTKNSEDQAVSYNERNLHLTTKSNIETILPMNQIFSPELLSDDNLKDKSISLQSSERSKTSTLSNQSSDSEEMRLQEDKVLPSKFTAPCHAPVVWCKSLEPLRSLKLKQAMSLHARAKAVTIKSSSDSDSDNHNINAVPNKLQTTKEEKVASPEVVKDRITKNKSKLQKSLRRIKSASDNITTFSSSIDTDEVKPKPKKLLKRAKTTYDLPSISGESKCESSDEQDIDVEVENISGDINVNDNLPYSDIITSHQADSPPSPIMSVEDITNVITECLSKDFSAPNLLDRLSSEFIKRIQVKYKTTDNYREKNRLRLGLNLFKSLIDSRQYIKSNIFNPDLEFSHKQPQVLNSRQLKCILPEKSYYLVSSILGVSKVYKSDASDVNQSIRGNTNRNSEDKKSELSIGLVVHPGTSKDSTTNFEKFHVDLHNPYALFLKKPRRKAVTWRPLRKEDLVNYDPEATLKMRAARLMKRICNEFCEWLDKLDENAQMIDAETLHDMFEINFSSDVCKATQVILKEIPTVPNVIVNERNCLDADELKNTRKQIKMDLKTEKRSKHTFAFGKTLPRELRFIPPQGGLAAKWLQCENIPKDVETMDVTWDGIMHLNSVRSFINYLKKNPEVVSQKLLKNLNKRSITKKREEADI